MSIKILTPDQIKSGYKFQTPALLFPNLDNLFNQRRERFLALAKEHPLADYLRFLAKLVAAQQKALHEHQITVVPVLNNKQLAHYPLDARTWKRDSIWIDMLKLILNEAQIDATPELNATITTLKTMNDDELNKIADKLLNEDFQAISNDKALFIWAALMVYFRQLASLIPHNAVKESGDDLSHCPVCHTAPTASIVHIGNEQGLRYLHCALCETEWNVVRAKCTNCNESGKIEYFMLDQEFAPIRTEACDDCKSYLKIFYQEKAPHLDILADDLASIFLDMETGQKGYVKTGINPYLFMSE